MFADLFGPVALAFNGTGLLLLAVAVVALVVLGLFLTPRAFVNRRLRRVAEGAGLTVSHRTRQGEQAVSFPRVMKRARTPFGYRLTVALPSGMSVDDVTRHDSELADGLSAQEVRVSRGRPGSPCSRCICGMRRLRRSTSTPCTSRSGRQVRAVICGYPSASVMMVPRTGWASGICSS